MLTKTGRPFAKSVLHAWSDDQYLTMVGVMVGAIHTGDLKKGDPTNDTPANQIRKKTGSPLSTSYNKKEHAALEV